MKFTSAELELLERLRFYQRKAKLQDCRFHARDLRRLLRAIHRPAVGGIRGLTGLLREYFGVDYRLGVEGEVEIYSPIAEEMLKKDYLLKNIAKDPAWQSQNYIVPFSCKT